MSKPREWWICDAEDRQFLERFKWHIKKDKKTSYVYTNVKIGGKQTSLSMHRLICGLVASEIDHINRDGLDNRKENLRFCSSKQNQCNRVRQNSHGYRGVYLPKNSSNFAFQIQFDGKKYQKSGFATAEAAARAYDEKSKEVHGEFGIRNFAD